MHRRAGVVYVHAVAPPRARSGHALGGSSSPRASPARSTASEDLVWPPTAPPSPDACSPWPPLPSSCQPPNRFLSSSESDVLRPAWSGMQVPGPDRPGGPRAIAIVDVDVPRAVYSSQSCTPRFHPSRIHFSSPITGTRRSTGPLLLRCMYVLAAPFSRYRYRTP